MPNPQESSDFTARHRAVPNYGRITGNTEITRHIFRPSTRAREGRFPLQWAVFSRTATPALVPGRTALKATQGSRW